ncbi:ATP-binding cassette domain-containing protein [Puia dinghuensis]|uniref:ABC transporter ATP-binding protein n=1 Tax=Puia dinghuensis TaxID=1792502 RepID=A0A8J2UCV9_9BACT|nr:ABC transporter ATP-binding protein [Puia dinghuensis]GGA99919.1 hypothetical protein GCM10011511_24040 [Puia dinghuensis]
MKQIIRNTILILTPAERKKGMVLVLLNLVVSILDVGFLAGLLFVVQLYSGAPAISRLSFLPSWLTDPTSLWPIGGFFLLFAVKNLASFLVFKAQCQFRYQVFLRISDHNLLQYLEGSYSDYVHIDSSTHFAEVNLQPSEFCQHVMEGLQQSIAEWTLIGLTTIAILLFNAKLFFLLLVVLFPPIIIAAWFTRKKILSAKANIADTRDMGWQRLEESIGGFVESNLYDKKEFFMGRYHRSQLTLNRHLSNLHSMQGAPTRLAEVFAVFGLLTLIAIDHLTGARQGTGVVTLGAFLAAAYKIIPGVARILNLNGQIRAYAYTIDPLVRKRKKKMAPQRDADTGKIASITLRDISFRYGKDQPPVLEHLNLHIDSGCFLGISGNSGRGKTTLLNILLGFLTPEKGEVLINGRATDHRDRKSYWAPISYVKQQPFILHDTLLTNITLDEEYYNEEKLDEVLAVSGLDTMVKRSQSGIRTRIAENGKNISGGQRQRITIARALYKEADVFILDEPFSELDEASEQRLLHHFRQLTRDGKIVILITHNQKSLAFCDSVISLEDKAVSDPSARNHTSFL